MLITDEVRRRGETALEEQTPVHRVLRRPAEMLACHGLLQVVSGQWLVVRQNVSFN